MRYNARMLLLGLSGYAQTGKDTVADRLCDVHGFERVAFADLLRRCAEALDPIIAVDSDGFPVTYAEALHHLGYEQSKAVFPEFRAILQRLGTDVGRRLLSDNIWVDATMASLDPDFDYVITDVRFPNEAQAVIEGNGLVVRVQRPGTAPVNAHPSEVAVDDWDFDRYIENSGTIKELNDRVDQLVEELRTS